jgi:dipeptidyl aminopeptidase/acylaminoacyl peptidase
MRLKSLLPMKSQALAAVLVLVLAPALSAQLTPEQVAQLRTVTSAALSPDGASVAFTVSEPRTPEEDTVPGLRAQTRLYVVPAAGGNPRAVVAPPLVASSAAWSPDGTRLGFLHRGQVHTVPAAGGEPRQVTDAPGGVMAFRWSPDGRTVAYTSRVPESPEAAERRRRGDDVQVAEGAYLPWVHPIQGPRPVRLWVQPAEGGQARALTPDDLWVRDFVWAPDSRRLALQVTDEGDADAELMFRRIVTTTVEGGSLTPFVETEGKLGPMAFSPDGSRLAWLGATAMNDPLAQSLFVAEAGGAPRNLTPDYEGSLMWIEWQDNATLRFVAVESTRTALRTVPARGGEFRRVAGGGAEIFQTASFSSNGRSFAVPASTAAHPAEVFVGDARSGTLRRVTTHNAFLADVPLGRQETISYTARDGLRIDAVLIHPVGAEPGVRAPLAILPHGGPEGYDMDGWSTRALYPGQLLAGQGYAVFLPNYRASGGRGVAFSKGDHRDLGGREFDDVLDGIDHLHEIGVADRDRVGISGTSYGGYFSAWAGTRHPERFRLAMPFAGISNWMSFTGTTDIPLEMALVHWDLLPWEHPLLMWERSPLAHLDENSTPMVIGHGLVDERVHPEQMIQLHQFLRLRGVPTELILYPREPHGLLERQHQLDYMRRILEAFDRWVRPEERPVTEE